MNYSGLSSILELAYAPLSSHDFAQLKKDEDIQHIVRDSMLYAICQRPMLTFENVVGAPDESGLHFEIHQQNSSHKLICFLPFNQPALDADGTGLTAALGHYDEAHQNHIPPISRVNGIQFYTLKEEFRLWLTPDRFLHLYWQQELDAVVTGDHREFTNFLVHYVGKATDQPIMKRLTGHYSLQDILSTQKPLVAGTLPSHEIMLLLLRARPDTQLSMLGDDVGDVDDFVDKLLAESAPSQRTVSLDAEKVLVNLLNPEFNHPDKRFPNYPQSTDGLYKHNFDRFTYQIKDDITLAYDKVSIQGSVDTTAADIIAITANDTVEILKLR